MRTWCNGSPLVWDGDERRFARVNAELLVTGRSRELQWIDEWMRADTHAMQLLMVCGPAGIGKSTVLDAIAQRAQTAGVPAWRTDGRYMNTPTAWIDYLGLLLLQGVGGTASVRPDPSDRLANLRQLVSLFSTHQGILLIDNAEFLGMTGEWLRTQWFPTLRDAGLLVVMATRTPLMEWVTDTLWRNRLIQWQLPPLTYPETLAYLAARDIDVQRWGAIVFQSTHGHPLSVALTADSVSRDPGTLVEVSQMVTLQVLREVVSEDWMPHLEALAMVQEANQATLAAMTGRDLGSLDYHRFLSLSFVSPDARGLKMHDTIRQILLQDLRQRFPQRYQALRHRALTVLGERNGDDTALRLRTAAILLELYRDDLPVEPWMTFSAVTAWEDNSQPLPHERPYLHQMLPKMPRSRLISVAQQHAFLDALMEVHPEGIRVVRHARHEPIGFWAGLWLSEKTLPLLQTYLPRLAAALPPALQRAAQGPQELADTCVTVFFCCRGNVPALTIEQVRGLVLWDALVILGGSVRVMVTSEDPAFRQVMSSMGLRPQTFVARHGDRVEVLVADKRGKGFLAFLWFLDRLGRTLPNPEHRVLHGDELQRLLRAFGHAEMLEQEVRALGLDETPHAVAERIRTYLSAVPPIAPLTPMEQRLLRYTYWEQNSTSAAIAAKLHVSRSSYYRYRERALARMTAWWNR